MIFKTNVVAVVLDGWQTRTTTKEDESKIYVFQHKYSKEILKVYRPIEVRNE